MSDQKSVLIVEDNFLIAMNLKTEFEAKGWQIIGPSPNSKEALAYIQSQQIDVACLDFNLEHNTSEDVAKALLEKNIPFLFLTGDDLELQETDYGEEPPILLKPIDMKELLSTTMKLLNREEKQQ